MKSKVIFPTSLMEQDFWKQEYPYSKVKIVTELFFFTSESNIVTSSDYLEKKWGLPLANILSLFEHEYLKKYFQIKENSPGLYEIKRKGKTIASKEEEEDLTEALEIAKAIIVVFNEQFKTRYKEKHADGIVKNVLHWMAYYSKNEMIEAVKRARMDEFWCDKMTPTLLFRKRNPKGEDVDYMGNLLNRKRKLKQTTAIGRLVEMS